MTVDAAAYVAFMLASGQPAPVTPKPKPEPVVVDYVPDVFSQWRHKSATYEEHPADPDLTAVTVGEADHYEAKCLVCDRLLHEFRP